MSEKQVENINRPRIRIAPLNGVAERIELTAVRRKDEQYRWRNGRFLDLHTLAFALTDASYTLENAIHEFGSKPKKMKHKPTGQITEKEIAYARQDVRATFGLLNALKREYDLHPIALPQTVPIVPHPSVKRIYAQWALNNLWISSRTSRLEFMESLWRLISEDVQNAVFVDGRFR